MSKRLQFVVGKGGVGKSTVAAALAVAAAGPNERVLLLELGAPGGAARLLSPGKPGRGPVEVLDGLYLDCVEGDAALAEYLELVVPIRRLLRLVFESNLYRSFVAAAPGLKELMTMGKIWFEAERRDAAGKPLWDCIVVDAGASGHSLKYLQMPATAAATFKSGLVHRESQRVEALLEDPSLSVVHVVASPEDMPLFEAAEIVEKLNGPLSMPFGKLFVNRCRERPPEGAGTAVDSLRRFTPLPEQRALRDAVVDAAASCLGWYRVQERGIAAVEDRLGLRVCRLPLQQSEEFGLAELRLLASLVKDAVQDPGGTSDSRDEVS